MREPVRREVSAVAQRGRKPKPTAVKVLEGNPGKRGLNAGEDKESDAMELLLFKGGGG